MNSEQIQKATKEYAAEIKKMLKKSLFSKGGKNPALKVVISSEWYIQIIRSIGKGEHSVRVLWLDGPTKKQVEAAIKKSVKAPKCKILLDLNRYYSNKIYMGLGQEVSEKFGIKNELEFMTVTSNQNKVKEEMSKEFAEKLGKFVDTLEEKELPMPDEEEVTKNWRNVS